TALYGIRQAPYASYEVVVDLASGDAGNLNGPALDLVGADGDHVLKAATAAGRGPARSLRWQNGAAAVDDQLVPVRSNGCATSCGVDDVYRIRAYETTYAVPRFNNAGGQVTVLLLQNSTADTVSGTASFRSPAGAILGSKTFTLAPHGALSLNTT